jgi:hypothetical protein
MAYVPRFSWMLSRVQCSIVGLSVIDSKVLSGCLCSRVGCFQPLIGVFQVEHRCHLAAEMARSIHFVQL